MSSADLSQLTAQPRKVARLGVCMRWLISAPRVYALKPGDNAPDCSVPFEDTVKVMTCIKKAICEQFSCVAFTLSGLAHCQ